MYLVHLISGGDAKAVGRQRGPPGVDLLSNAVLGLEQLCAKIALLCIFEAVCAANMAFRGIAS